MNSLKILGGGSTGSRGGGVATAARTGGAKGMPAGGGIESGRGGSTSNFGNTGKFESSFSSKSFATAGERKAPDTSKKVPSFSIDRAGTLISKTNKAQSPSRAEGIHAKTDSLFRRFGPKYEITKPVTQDTRQPGRSLNSLQTIYKSQADRRYHETPGHSNVHTEVKGIPLRQGFEGQAQRAGGDRGIRVEGRNGERGGMAGMIGEKSVSTNRVSEVAKVAEVSRVSNSTKESMTMKPRDIHEIKTKPVAMTHPLIAETRPYVLGQDRPTQTYMKATEYIRPNGSISPVKENLVISPKGKLTKSSANTGSSEKWQHLLAQKMDKKDGVRTGSLNPVMSVEKTLNPAQMKQVVSTEKPTDFRKLTRDAHVADQLLLSRTPQQREATITRALEAKVSPRFEREKLTTQLSQKKAITYAETSSLLRSYQEMYLQPNTQTEMHTARALRKSNIPEVEADFEQAVQVMRALHAVGKTGEYTFEEKAMEKMVLKALDVKLTKTGLKEALMETEKPVVKTATTTENTPNIPNTPIATSETDQPNEKPESDVIPENSNEPILPENEEELAEEIPEAEVLPEEEQVIFLYARDEKRDAFRYAVAIEIAEAVAGKHIESYIPGYAFLQVMGNPYLYNKLRSIIAPGPDEYLTEIIESLSSQDYRSVNEVREKIYYLTRIKPAVTIDNYQSIDPRDAQYVQNSTSYPRAA